MATKDPVTGKFTKVQVPENKLYPHWNQVDMKTGWRWPNFSPEEIATNEFVKGNSGPRIKQSVLVDARSMDMLQELRTKLGKPFMVNSAYRSPKYNGQIGGEPNGYHPKGMAFDISMENHDPLEFEKAAIEVGFRGIGHYPGSNFMHIDTRKQTRVSKWFGTGKNARWFKPVHQDVGESVFTPEPVPATVTNSLLKPETITLAATAIGTSGLAPALASNGPLAWAAGAAIILALAVGAAILIRKYRAPKLGD